MFIANRLADRWEPWFLAINALGENTQIRWGKVGQDGDLIESGLVTRDEYLEKLHTPEQ